MSRQILERAGYPESLEFEFDQTAFLACVTMWHKIAELALNSSLVLMERLNVPYREGSATRVDNLECKPSARRR